MRLKIILLLFLFLPISTISEILKIEIGNNKSAELYFEEVGEGKPIVILHGGIKQLMESIFNDVKGYKRIYIDPPGIGKSSSDNWIRTGNDCLNILSKAIDILTSKENYLVCGFSYFGYQSMGLMIKDSMRIDGAVLICPVIYPNKNERDLLINREEIEDNFYRDSLNNDEKELLKGFVNRTNESYKAVTKYSNSDVLMNVEFWNRIKENDYSHLYGIKSIKKSIDTPLLAFVGLQDEVVGYRDALSLFNHFERLSFISIDYASHNLPYEQYNLFKCTLTKWLNEVK